MFLAIFSLQYIYAIIDPHSTRIPDNLRAQPECVRPIASGKYCLAASAGARYDRKFAIPLGVPVIEERRTLRQEAGWVHSCRRVAALSGTAIYRQQSWTKRGRSRKSAPRPFLRPGAPVEWCLLSAARLHGCGRTRVRYSRYAAPVRWAPAHSHDARRERGVSPDSGFHVARRWQTVAASSAAGRHDLRQAVRSSLEGD